MRKISKTILILVAVLTLCLILLWVLWDWSWAWKLISRLYGTAGHIVLRLLIVLCAAFLILLCVLLWNWLGGWKLIPQLYNKDWFKKMVTVAQPIVSALEKYKNINKGYPKELEDLIPKYLAFLPIVEDKHGTPESWLYERHGRSYELWVSFDHFVSTLQTFIYWPEKCYPDNLYESSNLRKIDGWAYVGLHDCDANHEVEHLEFLRDKNNIENGK